MKRMSGTLMAAIGVAMLAAVFVPSANAQCMSPKIFKRSALMIPQPFLNGELSPAAFTSVAYGVVEASADVNPDPIVGMWSVEFIAEGNTAASTGLPGDLVPPDGAVLDRGNSQWHSDGTEIHNSGVRPPPTQSYCLGVWKRVGPSEYKLNHFAISWNLDGTLQGPANIRQDITLGRDHNSFTGTFTIDQYNTGNNLLVHLTGTIQGKRITMDTTVNDLL